VSLERVLKALMNLGLSQKEAEVYVYLATKGPQKAANIAETLKLTRPQLQSTLKNLQDKKIVKATFEYSAQFSALPFETALDLLTEKKRKETRHIEENKQEILSHWRSISN
jgi:sugar-specific transcriptional regulator TrmB